MAQYNFKEICVVPNAADFIDIILSKTQRKTPTVVHKRYKISNIRQFYMRKVKFCASVIKDRIIQLLSSFPRVDNIHPFYGDLIHVLYDKDHYKLALGQLNVAKNIVENICKDYIKLLKYADSLYRCKKLKKAALGRMCTTLKKQDVSLKYLEEVRQHLARLPSIDPNTRTLIMTGYPNVGKSSFINKVSRAEVDVQPYAFTTKSLFVGHFFHKYIRWQAIDTPGILDHPLQSLEGCNNIEMQAITAIAHIQSCILFFIDLSPNCEYSIDKQLHLFEFLHPIFNEKPILFVASKCDLRRLEELKPEEKSKIQAVRERLNIPIIELSNLSEEGIMKVRAKACEMLLDLRVQGKLDSKKGAALSSKINVTVPVKRDNLARGVSIPESVIRAKTEPKKKRKTTKEIQDENGGAGKYCFNLREHWKLKKDEWKFDSIPEIVNGQNVIDWIDPDIEKKLDQLEKDEKEEADKMEDESSEGLNEDEQELYDAIATKKDQIVLMSRLGKSQNKPRMGRILNKRSEEEMAKSLSSIGLNPDKAIESRKNLQKSKRREKLRSRLIEESKSRKQRKNSRPESSQLQLAREKAAKKTKNSIFKKSLMGRSGPGDRRVECKMPKHLFSGKRKMGKTSRR